MALIRHLNSRANMPPSVAVIPSPPPVMTLNPVPLQPWAGQEIQLQARELPVIVITAHGTVDTAVEIMAQRWRSRPVPGGGAA